jgi:hypothetical protein
MIYHYTQLYVIFFLENNLKKNIFLNGRELVKYLF